MTDLIDEEGVPEIEMPALITGYSVKGGELTRRQQEIDAGRDIAVSLEEEGQRTPGDGQGRTIYFAERSAFDMTGQLQFFYPISCCGSHKIRYIRRSMIVRSRHTRICVLSNSKGMGGLMFDPYMGRIHVLQGVLDMRRIPDPGRDGEIQLKKCRILLIHFYVQLIAQ